jgi:hypothetical protein
VEQLSRLLGKMEGVAGVMSVARETLVLSRDSA